jgi:hypothetical protein
MPDNSLPQQFDAVTKRQVLETISLEDLAAAVQTRLIPDGGGLGQVLTRTLGGAAWSNAGQPNFTTGTVTTSPNLLDANVIVNGTAPNFILDWTLPVGLGATPNLSVHPVVNMLTPGVQGQAYMIGTQANPQLVLSLPRSPVPSFYVNNVTYGITPFDADVYLVGGPENIGFNFKLPRGLQGITGLTPNLSVRPFVTPLPVGTQGQATISGTPENPILNLDLPLSPVPNFSIGSVSTVGFGFPATAQIIGSPANPQLNLGIPAGQPGQPPNLGIGTVTPGANPSDAQASFTGTPQNPLLNLILPRGYTGLTPILAVNPNVTPLAVGSTGQATISGTPENPVLTLALPLSPVPNFAVGTTTTLAPGANATVGISGTPANPLLSIGVPQGLPGATPNLGVNPLVTMLPVNAQGQATMTGTVLNPILNLSLPRSPVPNFAVGTTSTLAPGSAATVSLTGTLENPLLNIGVPQGATGASPNFTIGTITTLPSGASASANLTGTPLNPILNLSLPRGQTGTGGINVNGFGPYDNIVVGGGNQGAINPDTSGQPAGTIRLTATHRLLNAATSFPTSRALVQIPGDASAHVIKQIRGIDGLYAIDAGNEIQIGADILGGILPTATYGQTLRMNSAQTDWEAIDKLKVTDFGANLTVFTNNGGLANKTSELQIFNDSFFSHRVYLTTNYSNPSVPGSFNDSGLIFSTERLDLYNRWQGNNNRIAQFGSTTQITTGTLNINNTSYGIFGVPPVARQTVPPAANDLASVITLANAMRLAGLNYGHYQ